MAINKLATYDLPTSVGEQVRVNHEGCSAGSDSKKRLYIKMASPNSYVYYCHHCGDKGVEYKSLSDTEYARVASYLVSGSEKKTPTDGIMLADVRPITDFNITSYLKGYYIDDLDLPRFPLGQLNSIGKVPQLCVPNMLAYDGKRFFGQLRSFDANNFYRYRTTANTPQVNYFGGTDLASDLYIVEDSISAYRVYRDSGFKVRALSLQGTGISDEKVGAICNIPLTGKATVWIWLDNDEAGKTASIKLSRKISPLVKAKVFNITGNHEEPKLLTPNTLNAIIGV